MNLKLQKAQKSRKNSHKNWKRAQKSKRNNQKNSNSSIKTMRLQLKLSSKNVQIDLYFKDCPKVSVKAMFVGINLEKPFGELLEQFTFLIGEITQAMGKTKNLFFPKKYFMKSSL